MTAQLWNIDLWAGDTYPPFIVRFPWTVGDGIALFRVSVEGQTEEFRSDEPGSGVTIEQRGEDPVGEARHVVWNIPPHLRAGVCSDIQYRLIMTLTGGTQTYLYGSITTKGAFNE